MDIYIEYVIIDNMAINSLLLWGALVTLRQRVRKWRILLSAAAGTLLAAVLPVLPVSGVFAFIIKITTGLIMILIAADCKKFKKYAAVFLVFLAYTFILGGAASALLYGTADVTSALTVNYMSDFPIGLLVIAVALLVFLIVTLFKYIFREKDFAGYLRRAELQICGHTYKTVAFIDTGNMLYDSESGLPVVVVNKSLIKDALADMVLQNLTKKDEKAARYIDISTAAGITKMMILRPEKLTVYHKGDKGVNIIDKFCVGVAGEELKYDILLHPAVI